MFVSKTIAILITRGCNKKGLEYRVAHMPKADGLTNNPDYPSSDKPVINRDSALKIFGNCRVIYKEADALNRAKQLESKKGFTAEHLVIFHQENINFPAYRPRKKMIGHMMFRCRTS